VLTFFTSSSYLFLSLSSEWSCQKAAATFRLGDQKIVKKVKVVAFSLHLRRDRRHKKTFKRRRRVRGNLFFPISVIIVSFCVVCEEDNDKEEDKKKRSTPSLRVHPFLRLFFVSRSFFFRGGEEI
jgi:hypothetical protein